jgi:hypothetical protein
MHLYYKFISAIIILWIIIGDPASALAKTLYSNYLFDYLLFIYSIIYNILSILIKVFWFGIEARIPSGCSIRSYESCFRMQLAMRYERIQRQKLSVTCQEWQNLLSIIPGNWHKKSKGV